MSGNGVDLWEPGSYHADPLGVAERVRQLPSQNSRAVAASMVVKPTSGLLYGFWVSSVAAQFIQVFDLAALPADGVVPLLSFPVAATSGVGANWLPARSFRNGLVFCNSSTQHTKTIGSADCIFDVQFL
jgi:hypothetical protein